MSRMQTVAVLGLLLGTFSPLHADLHFPQAEVKLGAVYSGRPLRHRFSFTNQGPGAVNIQRLSAACGCLTPRLDKLAYRAGESGSFILEVNTLTQPAGQNTWRIQVHYTDGAQERTKELLLCATLQSEIKVEPPKLALSTTGAIGSDILVSDTRALPFHVTQAQASSPHLVARVTAGVDGRSFRVHLNVKATLPPGRYEETLSILTDDPDYRELRVPVTVTMRPRAGVTATPASVTLTIPRGQPAPSRRVLLRGENEQEVIVERIESDNPALKCNWAAGPGKMATLKVSVDASRAGELLRATVRVHVSKPVPGVVTIPVVCSER